MKTLRNSDECYYHAGKGAVYVLIYRADAPSINPDDCRPLCRRCCNRVMRHLERFG